MAQTLGPDQQRAVNIALSGKSLFLTGGAGVGKSHTLHSITAALTSQGRRVAVTASTGEADGRCNSAATCLVTWSLHVLCTIPRRHSSSQHWWLHHPLLGWPAG